MQPGLLLIWRGDLLLMLEWLCVRLSQSAGADADTLVATTAGISNALAKLPQTVRHSHLPSAKNGAALILCALLALEGGCAALGCLSLGSGRLDLRRLVRDSGQNACCANLKTKHATSKSGSEHNRAK